MTKSVSVNRGSQERIRISKGRFKFVLSISHGDGQKAKIEIEIDWWKRLIPSEIRSLVLEQVPNLQEPIVADVIGALYYFCGKNAYEPGEPGFTVEEDT